MLEIKGYKPDTYICQITHTLGSDLSAAQSTSMRCNIPIPGELSIQRSTFWKDGHSVTIRPLGVSHVLIQNADGTEGEQDDWESEIRITSTDIIVTVINMYDAALPEGTEWIHRFEVKRLTDGMARIPLSVNGWVIAAFPFV